MQIREILKSPITIFIFWTLVMGGVWYGYSLQGEKNVNEILEAPAMSTGIVRSVVFKAKKGYYIEYDFTIDGISTYATTYRSQVPAGIVNRSFPVIYSKTHNDKNEILIFSDDFKEFNLPYPDSLRWITNHR